MLKGGWIRTQETFLKELITNVNILNYCPIFFLKPNR